MAFYELVWDGHMKHFKSLEKRPHIWSSSTLYNTKMREERELWFQDFKKENNLNPETLYNFHQTAGNGNLDYGVIMNRQYVKTTSITRVFKNQNSLSMDYRDLNTNEQTSKSFNNLVF
jgi:hypothetical protein